MLSKKLVLAVSLGFSALPALAQTAPLAGTSYSDSPSGEGDPAAITCRPPQRRPESRLPGPEVCKTNAVWARYRRDGMDVAADGIHDVPSEKKRSTSIQACRPVNMGGGSTSGAMATNFSMVCD